MSAQTVVGLDAFAGDAGGDASASKPSATLDLATSRADDALTDPEPIRSLHGQFSNLGLYEAHVLDSTTLTAEATADSILQGVTRGSYLLNPSDSIADANDSIHNS